jgi:hypothetical protein
VKNLKRHLKRQHDIEDDSSKQEENVGHGNVSDTESWIAQDPGDLSEVLPETVGNDSESEEDTNTDECAVDHSSEKGKELELGRSIRKPTRPLPVFAPMKVAPTGKARHSDVVPCKKQMQDKLCQTDQLYFTESVKVITTWREDGKKIKKIEKKRLL